MISLYLMIPLGLALMGLAIWLFVWALKSGQFEDLDGPAWSIIMDEDQTPEQAETAKKVQLDGSDCKSGEQIK